MSSVKMFRVPNRIGRIALGNGGVTARDAIKAADAAVDGVRPQFLETMDKALREIELRFGPAAGSRDAEPLRDLYELALRIVDMSLGLPDSGVDEAARALCELADRCIARSVNHWEAIDLHLQALHLLRAHGQSFTAEQRDHVLVGLKQVMIKRVGDPDGAAAG